MPFVCMPSCCWVCVHSFLLFAGVCVFQCVRICLCLYMCLCMCVAGWGVFSFSLVCQCACVLSVGVCECVLVLVSVCANESVCERERVSASHHTPLRSD